MASLFCSAPKPGGWGKGPVERPPALLKGPAQEAGDSHGCTFFYRPLTLFGADAITYRRYQASDRPLGRVSQAIPAGSPLHARPRPKMARKAWTEWRAKAVTGLRMMARGEGRWVGIVERAWRRVEAWMGCEKPCGGPMPKWLKNVHIFGNIITRA